MYYANKALKELFGNESPKIIDRKESLLEKHYDAILILGNGNREENPSNVIKSGLVFDGKSFIPSPDAKARLVAGAELFRNGVTPLLIFSGGSTTKDSSVSEAQVAFHFLTQIGYEVDGEIYKIPEEALLIDNKAMDTSENLLNSQKFIDKHRIQKLGIISSGYHLERVGIYAESLLKSVQKVGLLASEDILNRTPDLAQKYPTNSEIAGNILIRLIKNVTPKALENFSRFVDPKGRILKNIAHRIRR